jgi:hypothetical protein
LVTNIPLSSTQISTTEKATLFATNVVGLDMSEYTITSTRIEKTPLSPGGYRDEQVTQRLDSPEGMIQVTYDFRNKELIEMSRLGLGEHTDFYPY